MVAVRSPGDCVIRLALRVARGDAELVLADLLELAPSGVEEVEIPSREGGEALVEYAVYGAPGELPELPDLRAAVGDSLIEVSTKEVPDDWQERWKRFHRSVLIEQTRGTAAGAVPALHVRPPWEPVSERPRVHEIVIDPAQAFGTGSHATTRLCLELLLELASAEERANAAVLDVGCGSGVLAIAAAKLGYRPVLALDNDRESVRATVANAAVNGVQIEARGLDLRHEALPWVGGDGYGLGGVPAARAGFEPTDGMGPDGVVVLANLLRPLLLELADAIAPPPRDVALDLIAGGLLRDQADEVAGAFAGRLGMRERERREQGEWVALWLARS